MLSAAGVQRSGTPAESKHPYPETTPDMNSSPARDGCREGNAVYMNS